MVEHWMQEPQNQVDFEQFLEWYWEEHLNEQREETVKPAEKKHRPLFRYISRAVAAAAVLAIVAGSVHYFTATGVVTESDRTSIAVVQPEHQPAGSNADTFNFLPKEAEVIKPKTKQYGKRKSPKNLVTQASAGIPDSTAMPVERPKTVKMTALNNIRLNDSLLSKMSRADQVEILNRMALNVNFNNAKFRDIAIAFREKYGIVLELCADAKPDNVLKEYTASFSKITLPDLIHDMSNQMMFSYTVTNNVVKVCFN